MTSRLPPLCKESNSHPRLRIRQDEQEPTDAPDHSFQLVKGTAVSHCVTRILHDPLRRFEPPRSQESLPLWLHARASIALHSSDSLTLPVTLLTRTLFFVSRAYKTRHFSLHMPQARPQRGISRAATKGGNRVQERQS